MTLLEVRFELPKTRDTIKYAITIDLPIKTLKKKKKETLNYVTVRPYLVGVKTRRMKKK